MPRVIADNGVTLLVEGDDGIQRPVAKSVYEKAFAPPPPPAPMFMGAPELDEPAPGGPVLGMSPDVQGLPAAPPPQLGAFGVPQQPRETEPIELPGEYKVHIPKGVVSKGKEKAPPAPAPGDPLSINETNERSRDADQAEAQNIETAADIEKRELDEVTNQLNVQDQRLGQIETQQETAHRAGMEKANAAYADSQKAVQAFQESTVDRGRLFKNMSTWDKVLMGIGVALSTIGQAKSRRGGPSEALKMIDAAVEADMADQREQRNQLGEIAKQKRTAYDDALAVTKNEHAAGELYKAKVERETARRLAIIEKQTQSEKVRTQANGMRIELERRIVDREKNVNLIVADEARKDETLRIQKSQNALDWAKFGWEKEKFDLQAKAASDAASREGLLIDPVTNEVLGKSRFADAKLNREDQDTINQEVEWRAAITDVQQKVEQYGRSGLMDSAEWSKSQEAAELDSAYQKALSAYAKSVSGAAVSEPEMKRLQNALPSRQKLWQRWEAGPILNSFRAAGDEKLKGFLRSRLQGESPKATNQNIENFFSRMDTIHRPKADYDKNASPAQVGWNMAETGKTAKDRAAGLRALTAELGRKPESFLGVNEVNRAKSIAASVTQDPNASNADKASAAEFLRRVNAANDKEFKRVNAEKSPGKGTERVGASF